MLKLFCPVEPMVLHFFDPTSKHSIECTPRPPTQKISLLLTASPKSFLDSSIFASISDHVFALGSYTSTVSRLRSLFLPPTAYTSPSNAHALKRKRGDFMGFNVTHFSCFVSKRSVDAKGPSGLWPPITYSFPDMNATPIFKRIDAYGFV